MSRYSVAVSDEENTVIHYGFDRPLREYFAQKYTDGKLIVEVNSRSDILDILDKTDAPQEHIGAIALDLEF